MSGKKLYLSDDNRKIAGVCGGIAEYLNLDPTVVRVVWVIVALIFGSGILAYLVAWLIMPKRPY
jgi:phage shock protein C